MTSLPTSRLFVTDFDGTLLTDGKIIHSSDLKTLHRLREKRITTAIATGRSLYSFQRALDQMGMEQNRLPVDYLIFSTGAGIMDLSNGKILLSHAIPRQDLVKITTYFDTIEFDYMVHRAIPDTPYFLFKSHGSENPDFQNRIRLYPSFGQPLEGSRLFKSATQVLAIVPNGIDQNRVAYIRSSLEDFSVIQATSPLDHSSAWIEVFHKRVSKSATVSWLAQQLDIPRNQVVSVGNDYNDQDLLEWSGQGFLVENGPRDMKPAFELVASNNNCGVSQSIFAAGLL